MVAKTASILNFCKIIIIQSISFLIMIFQNKQINTRTKIKILKPTKSLFKSIDILIIFTVDLKVKFKSN